MTRITLDHIRAAVALENFDASAAQRRMAPEARAMHRGSQHEGNPRRASVLILLFHGDNISGEDDGESGLAFALIQRTQNPHDQHSGQISLPGGAQELGETVTDTALRETREELGVSVPVHILGQLSCLYIFHSDFEVRPVVGYVAEHPVWIPDAAEVVDAIECPVAAAS
jgi:8-oxo-dGTP pyrophosphatase MutT (NUDIX family)